MTRGSPWHVWQEWQLEGPGLVRTVRRSGTELRRAPGRWGAGVGQGQGLAGGRLGDQPLEALRT